MGHFLQITIARKTRPFLKKAYTILLIANCRNGPVSANYDRKTNYKISLDRELQKWFTFYKLRSQEKLYHFSRKTTEFLVIMKCRNGPLSANYDRKKNFTISQEKLYSFS